MDWFDIGKNIFNKGKQWVETAGDINAASDNPQEKVNWMDRQQKKMEEEAKTIQPRRQQGFQQNVSPDRKQPDTTGQAPAGNPAQSSALKNDDPMYDWTGHPVSEEEKQRILKGQADVAENRPQVKSVLDKMKQLRQDQENGNRYAFQFDRDRSENNQTPPEKSAFEQAAQVNDPQDESMMPAFRHFGEMVMKALGNNSAVSGHGQTPVGEPDQSYIPFAKIIAKNITENLGNNSAVSGYGKSPVGHSDLSYISAADAAAKNITDNLGVKSAVSGYGRAPVGHSDSSYGPAIGDVSKNMGADSDVTGHGKYVIGAPNMTYWGNWADEDSRNMPFEMFSESAKQGWKDAQILFYSGASLFGEHLYNLVGGDDTSLRWVQGILDQHQKELKKMNRMMSDEVYVEGDPEKTMQNLTRYLYQELGNKTVGLPAYFILRYLNTFSLMFGVSSAVLSTQLYSDFREKTGDGHPVESIRYGVLLGLLSAALLPFKDTKTFKDAKQLKDYVQSLIVGVAVHKIQEEGKRKVVDGIRGKRDDDILR